MKIPFSKYQGTGNDFVMVDNRAHAFPSGDFALVKKLCDRRFGIGADGLILLDEKSDGTLQMTYFNSDGNPGTMCGNGGRCFAAFARQCGVPGDELTFEAADGIHLAIFTSLNPLTVKMSMGEVVAVEKEPDYLFLDTGSPHVVKFVSHVANYEVQREGRAIRNSERFKAKGTNVNFVQAAPDHLVVRTYERGVEDETYSCGTGVTASVLAAAFASLIRNSGPCAVHTPGGKLKVYFSKNGSGFKDVWLEGEATFVFHGEVDV